MCLSHVSRIRVKSPLSQSRVKVIYKFFEPDSSHHLVRLSQSGVTRAVESLQVFGFQAQDNVDKNEI